MISTKTIYFSLISKGEKKKEEKKRKKDEKREKKGKTGKKNTFFPVCKKEGNSVRSQQIV